MTQVKKKQIFSFFIPNESNTKFKYIHCGNLGGNSSMGVEGAVATEQTYPWVLTIVQDFFKNFYSSCSERDSKKFIIQVAVKGIVKNSFWFKSPFNVTENRLSTLSFDLSNWRFLVLVSLWNKKFTIYIFLNNHKRLIIHICDFLFLYDKKCAV